MKLFLYRDSYEKDGRKEMETVEWKQIEALYLSDQVKSLDVALELIFLI